MNLDLTLTLRETMASMERLSLTEARSEHWKAVLAEFEADLAQRKKMEAFIADVAFSNSPIETLRQRARQIINQNPEILK